MRADRRDAVPGCKAASDNKEGLAETKGEGQSSQIVANVGNRSFEISGPYVQYVRSTYVRFPYLNYPLANHILKR